MEDKKQTLWAIVDTEFLRLIEVGSFNRIDYVMENADSPYWRVLPSKLTDPDKLRSACSTSDKIRVYLNRVDSLLSLQSI